VGEAVDEERWALTYKIVLGLKWCCAICILRGLS